VRAVVDELAGRWPDAKLFAVGWSLGGVAQEFGRQSS